jgi:hypothetical protein
VCSAVVATTSIGLGYAALHLPAVLTFALPAMTHLASVSTVWDRTRFTDPHRRRATRQGLIGIAGIFMVVSAITLHLRLGQWESRCSLPVWSAVPAHSHSPCSFSRPLDKGTPDQPAMNPGAFGVRYGLASRSSWWRSWASACRRRPRRPTSERALCRTGPAGRQVRGRRPGPVAWWGCDERGSAGVAGLSRLRWQVVLGDLIGSEGGWQRCDVPTLQYSMLTGRWLRWSGACCRT